MSRTMAARETAAIAKAAGCASFNTLLFQRAPSMAGS